LVIREEVTLHDDELHNLYSSPNIGNVIKSRRMKCVGHVAHIWEFEKCIQNVGHKALCEETFIDLDIDWMIILK